MDNEIKGGGSKCPMGKWFGNCTMGECKNKCKERLESLWKGEISFFETFWYYFVGGVLVFGVLGKLIPPLDMLFNVLWLIWTMFMARPIMLSAGKYEGDKTWVMAAQIAAIIVALGSLMRLIY